ncbi:unnamed protein product [Tuber aestivum]|uniref:Beta-xylanase n=1 Tax=Tuber aestivum TaxID=59557 RepID=A0A292Q434_9PEZI|nr:unnamed protein product [Tuber aestivum]
MKSIPLVALFFLGPPVVIALLDAKIKEKGKMYFGSCADPNTLSDNNVQTILKANFGSVSPENSMKWDAIEPSRGSFSFGNADKLVDFAVRNGKLVRGHTLVWHAQLPSWVSNITDAATLTTVIQNHIATVVGRYKGQIYAWVDVVNEVFKEDGSFRSSVFYELLGENFIHIAFRAARDADLGAKLYINDYRLEIPSKKIDALLSFVGRLQSSGVPIDGIGAQGHFIVNQVGDVTPQLQRMADTGLDVALTELDIRIETPVTSALLTSQRSDYYTIIGACLNVTKCVGITTWGDSWVDRAMPGYGSPLLWDDNLVPKAAYDGVDTALN